RLVCSGSEYPDLLFKVPVTRTSPGLRAGYSRHRFRKPLFLHRYGSEGTKSVGNSKLKFLQPFFKFLLLEKAYVTASAHVGFCHFWHLSGAFTFIFVRVRPG